MYFIASKTDKDSLELAKGIAASLKESRLKYAVSKELPIAGAKRELSEKELNESDCRLVMAIGDDSFILKTFRRLGKRQIPLFAVASAQSFLAQANALNYKYCLNLIKKDKYYISKRSRLVAEFGRTTSPIGLNDIGLFSSKSASLLKYSLILDDEIFWKDIGDGVVVSTPTGSTGYSLSAGGSIVLGEPNILTLTPISSMEKHSPLVVSDTTKIKITGIEGYRPILIIDGEVRLPISAREVVIKKSPYYANFAMFSKEHQLESRLKKRAIKINIKRLKNLPASSKLIYRILQQEGSMSQKELISASLLPERTVRYALDTLSKKGLITSQPHFRDARQAVYGI